MLLINEDDLMKENNESIFEGLVFDDFELITEDGLRYGDLPFYCSFDRKIYKVLPFKIGSKHSRVDDSYVHGRFKIREASEKPIESFSISFNSKDNSFGYIVKYSGIKYKRESLYKKRLEYLIFILKGILYYSYEDFMRLSRDEYCNIVEKQILMSSMKTPEEFQTAVILFESGRTYESDKATGLIK